jgi:serine protease Do
LRKVVAPKLVWGTSAARTGTAVSRHQLKASLVATVVGLIVAWVLFASAQVVLVPPAAEQRNSKVPTLAPVLREITPAVVNISAQGHMQQENPLYRDPFFRQLMKTPEMVDRQFKATGSGVIVDAESRFVLTTNHVIDNASAIEVTTKDNKSFRAEVVGRDRENDLALLRLEGSQRLTAISIGDSGVLQVGDFVVAIGNPFGLGQTATLGIVSAVGRGGVGLGNENLIQTDASINPGNSGGPLVDLNGRLIGINTAILASSGGNLGIGFAVPINAARSFIATQRASYAQHPHAKSAFLPLPNETKTVRASLKPIIAH